jgi:hypothetical protein
VLNAVKDVKQSQIVEAQTTLDSLNKSKDIITFRQQYYQSLISQSYLPSETAALNSANDSVTYQQVAVALNTIAAILHLIPEIKAGFFTTLGATFGGSNIASALQSTASLMSSLSSISSTQSSMSSLLSGYLRRAQDWSLQKSLADLELIQIGKQIDAASIRLTIANTELANHILQIDNANEIDDYLHTKYTNQDLYERMIGQLSSVYFQSYQLAFEIAKRAEQCYRFELAIEDSNYIQFGYWDNLKKGLFAGELLYHDLKRMEMAYLDQNKREYEITKNISLNINDPIALLKLKETGDCIVDLSEDLFDMDNPGQYLRRIKSVSLTIPCVTGPYTSVNCRLTLIKSSLRKNTDTSGGYSRKADGDDNRFIDNIGAIQSIVTSNAQNDSGLFELNFHDERYVPFEGVGAISSWRIELDKDSNQFDFNTISDVIVHLRYTAREGGDEFRNLTKLGIKSNIQKAPTVQLFSAKHNFPNEWYQFLNPSDDQNDQNLSLQLKPSLFTFFFQNRVTQITKAEFFLIIKDSSIYSGDSSPYSQSPLKLFITLPIPSPLEIDLPGDSDFDGLPHSAPTSVSPPQQMESNWNVLAKESDIATIIDQLKITATSSDGTTSHTRLNPDAIDDLIIVFHCSIN